MIFTGTPLAGAYLIDVERYADDRGFFGRTFCAREFEKHGLNPRLVQCSISYNRRRGTLRGMHYQAPPHAEAKLVRCTAGAIYDVIVDLRPESRTRNRWFGVELSAANRRSLYIPEGMAHGFLTLSDETEVFYQMAEFYVADSARGVRWNDPAFSIEWPASVAAISERDRNYPDYSS
jgi:dTDP-4-dehydrorhamnose 3,5-epimerase